MDRPVEGPPRRYVGWVMNEPQSRLGIVTDKLVGSAAEDARAVASLPAAGRRVPYPLAGQPTADRRHRRGELDRLVEGRGRVERLRILCEYRGGGHVRGEWS